MNNLRINYFIFILYYFRCLKCYTNCYISIFWFNTSILRFRKKIYIIEYIICNCIIVSQLHIKFFHCCFICISIRIKIICLKFCILWEICTFFCFGSNRYPAIFICKICLRSLFRSFCHFWCRSCCFLRCLSYFRCCFWCCFRSNCLLWLFRFFWFFRILRVFGLLGFGRLGRLLWFLDFFLFRLFFRFFSLSCHFLFCCSRCGNIFAACENSVYARLLENHYNSQERRKVTLDVVLLVHVSSSLFLFFISFANMPPCSCINVCMIWVFVSFFALCSTPRPYFVR